MKTPGQELRYLLNERDEIVEVGDLWDRFALANGGAAAVSRHVLHRPLWHFLSDTTTATLYRQILERARRGNPFCCRIRCDGPAVRRFLDLVVDEHAEGRVAFRTVVLAEESREPVGWWGQGGCARWDLLRACSWCNRFDVEGLWLEAEEAVTRLELFLRTSVPQLTHTICGDCYARVNRLLDP